MSMESGLVVYESDGVTEVFNKNTRTLKVVKKIPFSRALRFTTTTYQDPLFASESPTWFFTASTMRTQLIEVSYDNDKITVRVNTIYKVKKDGSLYEDSDFDWSLYDGHYIMLAVY